MNILTDRFLTLLISRESDLAYTLLIIFAYVAKGFVKSTIIIILNTASLVLKGGVGTIIMLGSFSFAGIGKLVSKAKSGAIVGGRPI